MRAGSRRGLRRAVFPVLPIALLFGAVLITGCVGHDPAHRPVELAASWRAAAPVPAPVAIERGTRVVLSPLQQEAVIASVRGWMKVPSSASFGELRAARNRHGHITVCGTVDGTNGAGRRSGFAPFIGVLPVQAQTPVAPVFVTVEIGGAAHDRRIVEELCRESGIDPA